MKKVPFYPNLEDNLHCTQACLKMMLKFFLPDCEYSYGDLDKLSKHEPNKWTWNSAWMLNLAHNGFKIVNIEPLDYRQFALDGELYLKKIWSNNTFKMQKKMSNLKKEQEYAKYLTEELNVDLINRDPIINDIKNLIDKGYIVFVSINPCILDGCETDHHVSHLIVVTNIMQDKISFHDPGLPPIENREQKITKFEKAMIGEHKDNPNIIGIRFINSKKPSKIIK